MKILKRILIGLLSLILVLFISLTIYARNPYQPLAEMDTAIATLDTSSITIDDGSRYISYEVNNPIANILFIPGGLVDPHSYDNLVINLALNGYDVRVFKPFYDLAILTPNYASRFLSDDLDNIIMGHSLGGVVASMIASGNDKISTIIMMGSYPIKDISDKKSMIITAQYDIGMDEQKLQDSLKYVSTDNVIFNIDGGNHAQFGWYGPQKGDGEATITTLDQQTIVINKIVEFLQNNN